MRVLASALKHCTEDDVRHALRQPIRVLPEFKPDVAFYIGADSAGRVLEVLVDTTEDEPVVFHADLLRAPARQYLEGWR